MIEIHPREDTKLKKYSSEVLQCNKNFYSAVKLHGLVLAIVHTDKDWMEINAIQILFLFKTSSMHEIIVVDMFFIVIYQSIQESYIVRCISLCYVLN